MSSENNNNESKKPTVEETTSPKPDFKKPVIKVTVLEIHPAVYAQDTS